MNNNFLVRIDMKTKYWILAVLIASAVFFFIGRATIGKKETVRYVKGETVTRTIKVPEVKFVEIPKVVFLPQKPVTLKDSAIVYVTDTVKVIEEYTAINHYEFNVFDDSNGKLDVKQTIQYNQLKSFDYSFTPIYKHTTVTKKNLFEPYGSIGYNTFNQVSVGGGFFINNLGLEYSYIYDTRMMLTGHGLSVKLKF